MSKLNVFNSALFLIIFLASNAALADRKDSPGTSGENLGELATIIEEILVEEVDRTIDKAKDVIRENTGIDIGRRGYGQGREHNPLPACASDEARRELDQMQSEYNREIYKLEEELNRKLTRAEAEFEREAARENKAEKVYEKRGKLERKVDDAYAKFDEKLAMQNRKYDEKRDRIINKERGSDRCKEGGISRDKDRDDRGKDMAGREERGGRGERDRDIPDHARERFDESEASEVAREKSEAQSEAEEKAWWEFWK